MDLNKLKFIPQANLQKEEPKIEDLVEIKKEIEYSMKRVENTFSFKSTFIQKEETKGYTVATDGENVYLLHTDLEVDEPFSPKFLKGISTTTKFTSNYVGMLLNTYLKDVELFNFELIDNGVWKFVEATIEEESIITPITIDEIKKETPKVFLSDFLDMNEEELNTNNTLI